MPPNQRSKQRLELLSKHSSLLNLRFPLLHLNPNPFRPSNQMAKTVLHNHHHRRSLANRHLRPPRSINLHARQRRYLQLLVHHDPRRTPLDECIRIHGCWKNGLGFLAES